MRTFTEGSPKICRRLAEGRPSSRPPQLGALCYAAPSSNAMDLVWPKSKGAERKAIACKRSSRNPLRKQRSINLDTPCTAEAGGSTLVETCCAEGAPHTAEGFDQGAMRPFKNEGGNRRHLCDAALQVVPEQHRNT